MIGKVGNQPVNATDSQQVERPEKETPPSLKDAVVAERPARESAEQAASARKNEMSITGSTQRALLAAQLQSPAAAKQSPPPVAARQPESIRDAGSTKTLKLGDKGTEVENLQNELSLWQSKNNIPMSKFEHGVFTEETQRALRQFQLANGMLATGMADSNTKMRLRLENDPNFAQLDNQVKESVRSAFNNSENDPAAQENILKLATDRQFVHLLSKDSQVSALSGLMMHAADKEHLKNVQDAVLDVAILERNKTLDHLPDKTKAIVINTLFKKTENHPSSDVHFQDVSHFRQKVVTLAKDPEFARLSQTQQELVMDAVARNPHPGIAGTMNGILNSPGFKNMDERMKAQVIQLANENALYEVSYKQNPDHRLYHERLDGLAGLLHDPKFLAAPDDEKWAQLNAFKTSPPGGNIPIR